ncbi:hypothetical protein EUTSA_v10014918mg [Eutrema salsugineum]|uniref:Uncharacterized protein n=1 Tax=Eutrema salsugineum TaxID=72664 RepID=V4KTX2_EUTSA|nr:uncharacterized protein LOC18017217 [Eutrema salsugineum]ESQ41405.1 hypothetical protein EUTSA_v10014918mg [Eutrema salsugineum]
MEIHFISLGNYSNHHFYPMPMASSPKIINLPYKKLSLEDDVFGETTRRSSSYPYRFKRVVSLGGRRRIRVRVKIRRLARFVRKKATRVKIGILKILKRLKESQSHFGDLFAGNYLFMQVNPSSLNNKYVFDRSFQGQNGNCPYKLSLPRSFM